MNFNLLFENNINLYGLLIGSGLIISCSIYYLFRSNNINNLINNTEVITNEDIQDYLSNENIEFVTIEDEISDSDYDLASEYQSTFDTQSLIEVDTTELDLFFFPNVDLEVCDVAELKFFEISSIYSQEIAEHGISEEELMNIIGYFSDNELCTNFINELILLIITH